MTTDTVEQCASSPDSSVTNGSTTSSSDPGKMFIGGLNPNTTPDGLRDYFNKYGDIKECMIMRDPITRRSRGFGFVTFSDCTSVEKVLDSAPHVLDSKQIDPKVAVPKRSGQNGKPPITKTRKIFLGGIATSTTNEELRDYFSQFGKIESCELMMDKATNRHRGFGFITFESEDTAEKVCDIHFHDLNNKMVEAKQALPKEVMGTSSTLYKRNKFMRTPIPLFTGQLPPGYALTTLGRQQGYAYVPSYYFSPGGPLLYSPAAGVFLPGNSRLLPAATTSPGPGQPMMDFYATDMHASLMQASAHHNGTPPLHPGSPLVSTLIPAYQNGYQ